MSAAARTAERSAGRRQRLELAATVLLALAGVATAWATYQSTRWHGRQAEAQSASIAARVESTRAASLASRQVEIDVALFSQWLDAYAREQDALAGFYRGRFRPEFEPAFEAWAATEPRTNPRAPLSPFALPEYRLAATARADALEARASAFSAEVGTYIQRADNYVLAVVLFAAALFFAGISTRLDAPRLRAAILAIGSLIFIGAVVWLATLPVTVAV